jgi:hypothetical protein
MASEDSRSHGRFWAIRDLADDEVPSGSEEEDGAASGGSVPLPTIGDAFVACNPVTLKVFSFFS